MKTNLFSLLFFSLICTLSDPLFALNTISVETGGYDTASWQFTEELSTLWQAKDPENFFNFSPTISSSLAKKFENLEKGYSRLLIAPITAETENYALDKYKIAAVLWRVYLLPIDLGDSDDDITLTKERYFYTTSDSLITDTMMNAYSIPFFSEKLRRLYTLECCADENKNADIDSQTNIFSTQPPKITSRDISADILKIKHDTVKNIAHEYTDGILLYETMGSTKTLDELFETDIGWVGFDSSVIREMTNKYSWISSVRIPRSYDRTLSYKVGIFVLESEDTEFVEKLIDVLSNPPRNYFPRSPIIANISLRLTKEISPFILHEAALKHFDL